MVKLSQSVYRARYREVQGGTGRYKEVQDEVQGGTVSRDGGCG